ncbi:MAG TPA: SHOCT domain-containing protein [Verrucomicrobiota bacterium]|nr:SHOCT domain-containing protein [Verrucomicrobiota bacterium]
MKPHQILLSAALAAVVLAAGCAVGVGNTEGGVRPTAGQELLDLQKARDSGVISQEEFEQQRTRILNRRH